MYEKNFGLNPFGEEVRGVVYIVRGKAIANQAVYKDGKFLDLCEFPLGKFSTIEDAVAEVDSLKIEL